MSFEIFQEVRARTTEYISVTENGTFGLPRTFIDKQGITPDHKAVILYDPEARMVGLHFSLKNPKVGLAVRIPNPTQGGVIVAKTFFEIKQIDPKLYSGRYRDFQVKPLRDLGIPTDGNAYVFQLAQKEPSADEQVDTVSRDPLADDLSDEPINLDDIPF